MMTTTLVAVEPPFERTHSIDPGGALVSSGAAGLLAADELAGRSAGLTVAEQATIVELVRQARGVCPPNGVSGRFR